MIPFSYKERLLNMCQNAYCLIGESYNLVERFGDFPMLTENCLVMREFEMQRAAIGILEAYIGEADPAVVRVLSD